MKINIAFWNSLGQAIAPLLLIPIKLVIFITFGKKHFSFCWDRI